VALKVELKPNERVIIGTAVVRNGDQRTSLVIEGHAPILREKDILTPKTADTAAKLIYLTIQLMYIDGKIAENIGMYQNLLLEFQQAAPGSTQIILAIHNHILNGDLYKGLKEAKRLLEYERTVLDHAARNPSLCENPIPFPQSA